MASKNSKGRSSHPTAKPASANADAKPTEATACNAPPKCLGVRILYWFVSRTFRHARQMCKHVRRILSAQRDLLSPNAIAAVEAGITSTRTVIHSCAGKKEMLASMENLEKVANQWLKPYPRAAMRENVEVLLVALAVAMGVRTFFLQPFKIPTGSMQPTLFGITYTNYVDQPNVTFPNQLKRLYDFWVYGISYYHLTAPEDGRITKIAPPQKFLLFNLKQHYWFNDVRHTVWFPTDNMFERTGVLEPYTKNYERGQDILRMKTISGDHLFVNRMTYNFRQPSLGEIVVFKTVGISHPQVPRDQFYIKRLVGLPGDTVRIDNTDHLVINGKRLDDSTPRFENIYKAWPETNQRYCGHIHASPYFPDAESEVAVRKEHLLVMGDNTKSSLDSRYWGDFPARDVIGKSCFVYWPLNERFGLRHR